MTVKFEFIMEDVDAENLMRTVRNDALRNDDHIMDYMCREDLTEEQRDNYIQACLARKSYQLGLLEQMTNTWVKE